MRSSMAPSLTASAILCQEFATFEGPSRCATRRDRNLALRSGRRRRAYLADELGSGGCRAGRNEGCEREHVGYEHAPCAGVQQLADTKARAVEDVACLLNSDGSGGVSDDGTELTLQGCGCSSGHLAPDVLLTIGALRHADHQAVEATAPRCVRGARSSGC